MSFIKFVLGAAAFSGLVIFAAASLPAEPLGPREHRLNDDYFACDTPATLGQIQRAAREKRGREMDAFLNSKQCTVLPKYGRVELEKSDDTFAYVRWIDGTPYWTWADAVKDH
jgi:hypothetical protein